MQAHEHVSEPLPLGSLLGSMAVQEEWGGGVGRGEAQSGYTEVPASVRRMSSNLFHVVIMHTDKVRRLARSILATQCTKQRCVYERLRKLTLRVSYERVGVGLSEHLCGWFTRTVAGQIYLPNSGNVSSELFHNFLCTTPFSYLRVLNLVQCHLSKLPQKLACTVNCGCARTRSTTCSLAPVPRCS